MEQKALLERRFSRAPAMIFRRIADEAVLVPLANREGDPDCIYTLNEVGSRIWELIDGRRSALQIRDALVDEFVVTPEQAGSDLVEFLEQLDSIGALEVI